MSSRSTYSQRKKKEAVRRLSQGNARNVRSSRSNQDEAQRFGQGTHRQGNRRRRASRDDGRPASGGPFSGRRVIATASPSSGGHLLIQARMGGPSSPSDDPDTSPTVPRRRVTTAQEPRASQVVAAALFGKSTDAASAPAPGNVFNRVGGISGAGLFGSVQRSDDDAGRDEAGSRQPGSPSKKPVLHAEAAGLFGRPSVTFSAGVFKPPAEERIGVAGGRPSTGLREDASSPAESPGGLSGQAREGAPALETVTRNLFGRPAGKDSGPPQPLLFGKLASSLTTDSKASAQPKMAFGKAVAGAANPSVDPDEAPKPRSLLAQTRDKSGRQDRSGDPAAKRQLSPARVQASSKRTLSAFDDPFSSAATSDITDLETFGAAPRSRREKKPVIKRAGLFGKALAEASGGRGRDAAKAASPGSRSRSPEGKRTRSRSPIQPRQPERPSEEGTKRDRAESKSGRRPASSSASSRRYASPEEVKSLTAITLKDVPKEANSRAFLKEFFSRYGTVSRAYSTPAKNSSVVYFADHESAANALKRTKVLLRGTKPVSVFWRSNPRPRSENRPSHNDAGSPPSRRERQSKPSAPRQSLVPLNRKAETNVNPEDGTSRRAASLPTAAHPKTNLSVPANLLSKQVGLTAQERYDILEDRDRILRQGLKKKSHLATSAAIRGTCPDMCPEKERYMRVVQRRLHPYEVVPGTTDKVNHDTAVKEYSRSSADQEEPLPHEMRPAPVLTLTMNYLMRHVMNAGQDGHWADWFDFLWSRTRGIRKDIAQQDLRDQTAIDLMEKCARFHIFCSHRLCEEDLSTIDPKINNENLTKCMQSLKQFYHDLASEGAVSPNEAEFRAYDVLLNLNDRDILRQVQQYRPEVRCSEKVKFALKAFSAVSTNNYVKFFKLVRATTYLNACIMHRYFVQLRNLALDIMTRAYTISHSRESRFPLANIRATLAFDGQSQANDFCQSHNLAVDDDMVQFSRAAFQHPDISQSTERSLTVIEAKNTMTIGEVVNGGVLPSDVVHKPSSSFDESGHYKGYTVVAAETAVATETAAVVAAETAAVPVAPEEAASAEGAGHGEGGLFGTPEGQMITARSPIMPVAEVTAKTTYSNAEVKEVARGLFLEVIDEMVQDLCGNVLSWIRLFQQGSLEILQATIEGATAPLVRQIADGVLTEQRQSLEQQRHHEAQMAALSRRRQQEQEAVERLQRQRQEEAERRAQRDRDAETILRQTMEEVVTSETRKIADEEMREVQAQWRRESVERTTAELSEALLEEALEARCQEVASEVLRAERQRREQQLADCEKAILMGRMARYLQRWHRVYTKRLHLRRTLLTFPAAPPNQTAAEQLRVLWAGGGERPSRERIAEVTLDSPFGIVQGRETIAKSILRIHYLKTLRHQKAWSALDLPGLLSEAHRAHHRPAGAATGSHGDGPRPLYWKLVASLPDRLAPPDAVLLCDWLKAKLRRGRIPEAVRQDHLEDSKQMETLSLYSCQVSHVSPRQPCSLGVCTKVATGSLASHDQDMTRRQLQGTSGILFALEPAGSDQNLWHRAKTRLDSLLRGKPAAPPLPLVVLLLDWPATERAQTVCQEALQLPQLVAFGLVSSYRFAAVTADVELPETSKELSESLEWLSAHCPLTPPLWEDSLYGYLDTGMTEFFSCPIHEDAEARRQAWLPEQDCQSMLDLYNAVVRHLADVASSGALTSLSWPPTEFTKSDKHADLPKPNWNSRGNLRGLRERILGLLLPALPRTDENDDWESICRACHGYLLSLPGTGQGKAPLLARVRRILAKCRRGYGQACAKAFDVPGCEPLAGHAPWTRIIEECCDYLMSTMRSHNPVWDRSEQVYYLRSEFDHFQAPPSWQAAVKLTAEDTFAQPSRFATQVANSVQKNRADLAARQRTASATVTSDVVKPARPSDARAPSPAIAVAVRATLASEKKEAKKFDAQLQQWLENAGSAASLEGGIASLEGAAASLEGAAASLDGGVVSLEGGTVEDTGSPPALEQSLRDLRLAMEKEKRADRLAELRLASLLAL